MAGNRNATCIFSLGQVRAPFFHWVCLFMGGCRFCVCFMSWVHSSIFWRKIWKWMLFQIAHRLPAIEKNRWRARWEIYLLHARARAFGKVQQFGHPGALSDANARIIQRTSACTGGRVLGMEMWRDIWSRFIMGKGGGEWVIREGRCLALILKCHLHEMSPFSIFALQIWNLCYASVAVAIYNAFAVKWVRSKLGRAFICTSII